jgi:hypothetical protein
MIQFQVHSDRDTPHLRREISFDGGTCRRILAASSIQSITVQPYFA